ncbi:MAG: carboxypeptidase regulatory-like domain-containing protein [Bacteroidales bacterium]|nr:carboxypeptidase regulatory-like domain-containing protein [Bacteroidales bacterium]
MLTLLITCTPEEEIITGDIAGEVKLSDHFHIDEKVMPGIMPVRLDGQDGLNITTYTNEKGQFVFEDIPYGKYSIAASKEGYYPFPLGPISHLGGYSATYTQAYLQAIPTFQLELDSITFMNTVGYQVFLKLDGDTLVQTPEYWGINVIAFVSSSPDVSKDNYESFTNGSLSDMGSGGYWDKVRLYAMIYSLPLNPNSSAPIYFRLYPYASGGYAYNSYTVFDPLALGKPSNVLSVTWNDLFGE